MTKRNRNKQPNYVTDEQQEIKRFIIIVLAIILIVGVIYLFSYLKSRGNTYHYSEVNKGEVNYNIVSVGTMFTRHENEYYVALFKESDNNAVYYSTVISEYATRVKYGLKTVKLYYCNLDNKLNTDYLAKEDQNSNPKAKGINDLRLGDLTLIKIRNGQIVKYIENIDDIKTELGI